MIGTHEVTSIQDLVQETIERWRGGEQPDAAALLKRHPALAEHKSLAIDLIYEEYCLRNELGDTLVPSTFCQKFPHYRQSLARMLEVHHALEQSPGGALPTPIVWPKVGDLFLGYQLVESLGRGSLARVFLARETALGDRIVVVKVSRHGASEAQLLGKVAHPGIVPIFSVTHDNSSGWTAICLPFLGTATGNDLLDAAFADNRPPHSAAVISRVATQFQPLGTPAGAVAATNSRDWKRPYSEGIAQFGLLLAEGLQTAHAAGVMHRDIKPSNVLLSWSGRPMLLDFNLSTDISQVSQRVGGTLAYMAPEIIASLATDRGMSARQFDPRADLYSLGAMLYELLTGKLPAKPDDAESLPPNAFVPWLACRHQHIASPRTINPQVDAALEQIVLRTLAFQPADRQATAAQLASELRGHLGWAPTVSRRAREHRRALLLTAAGVAALFISGAAYSGRQPPYEERVFEQGLAQYDRGNFSTATATFGKCLDLKPGWAQAHFARGQALRLQGKLVDARTEYLAMQIEHRAVAYAMAGYCDLVQDDYASAWRDYSVAAEARASGVVFWNNYGLARQRQGMLPFAINCYTQAMADEPSSAVTYYNRARAHLDVAQATEQKLNPQALEDIETACRLSPDCAEFHFFGFLLYAAEGRANAEARDKALAFVRRSLELGWPLRSIESQAGVAGLPLAEISEELRQRANYDGQMPERVRPLLEPSRSAHLADLLAS